MKQSNLFNHKIQFLLILTMIFGLKSIAQEQIKEKSFPEIKGFVGIVHPIYTWSSEGDFVNFKNYYLFGMPCGINIWKNEKLGFSFEITPSIRSTTAESKVSNILFHPGILYRLGNGYTFAGRAAFDITGRYGVTPILSKILIKKTDWNLFVSILFPIRFGNNQAPTISSGILFGIGF